MIRRMHRVTVRFAPEEFERYTMLIGYYPKARNWTQLIHKALNRYHEASLTPPAVSDVKPIPPAIAATNGKVSDSRSAVRQRSKKPAAKKRTKVKV